MNQRTKILCIFHKRRKTCALSNVNCYLTVIFFCKLINGLNEKFKILDAARNIKIAGKYPLTFSIGVGHGASNLDESEHIARQCLDMALGRGGDQAVVKTENGYRYYDYLTKELPAFIESLLPVSSDPADRYVAGLSMGGYGAMKLALRSEGFYAKAGALSPVGDLRDYVAKNPMQNFVTSFGEDMQVPPEDDLLCLAERCEKRPPIYMTIGVSDPLYRNNIPLREKFAELGYDFTYHEAPGTHSWDYWDEHITEVMEWMFEG